MTVNLHNGFYFCPHPHLTNIYGDVRIPDGADIAEFVTIQDDVWIGENTRIGAFSFICSGTRIGKHCFLGQHVSICNHKHPERDEKDYEQGIKTYWKLEPVIIEDNVSIGSQVTLLPGITLGKGCKIGGGAVVTKSVPAGETWAGNPARKLENKYYEN